MSQDFVSYLGKKYWETGMTEDFLALHGEKPDVKEIGGETFICFRLSGVAAILDSDAIVQALQFYLTFRICIKA